jgi:hypothetical protein
MLLGFDFMPDDRIGDMSLNGLRRQDGAHNKIQIMSLMDESSVALYLENQFLSSGAPRFSFH